MVLVVLGGITIVVLAGIEMTLAQNDPNLRVTSVTNLVTWIGAIYAFCWGVFTYADKKEQSNKEPFLKEQLKLCFRASELAATLATESCPKKWDAARQEFWQLYWGSLSIVEDAGVESEMVDFGTLIPSKPASEVTLPMNALRLPSYKLAKKLRALVLASWNAQALGAVLDNKREKDLPSQDKTREAAT
jgi:hypothetical protein